jgi:EmrB/QacA subfamily drug resistance transporter
MNRIKFMPQTERDQQRFKQRWIGLLFIGISVIVISLDNTVLNTALPSISRQLGATENELQWIVDGYVLVFAALLLTTGSIGDRIGRKRALQIGLIWFGGLSLAAALAQTTPVLIIARAVLAVGSALILPATLSIITATFPTKERPQAIAIWAALFGLGVGIGPVLGGYLLQYFDWNSVFLVNLPTCAIALAGATIFLIESKDDHVLPFDIPGVLLSIVGLFALIYGIITAGVRGWGDFEVIAALAVGLAFLGGFAWWESRSPNAMLPMRFFKNMSFTSASVALSLIAFCQYCILFLLIPFLQTVQGYSTLQSGLLVIPLAATLTLMATVSARITARLGTKLTVALGIGIAAGGYLFIASTFNVNTTFIILLIGQVIVGFGVGMAFSPATNSIMGALPIDKAGVGSAMNDTTRQLGGALGIATLGTVLNISYIGQIVSLQGQLTPDQLALSENSVQGAHQVAQTLGNAALAQTLTNLSNQAYVLGMQHALIVGVIVLLGAAVFTLRFLPATVRRQEEQPVGNSEVVAAVGD